MIWGYPYFRKPRILYGRSNPDEVIVIRKMLTNNGRWKTNKTMVLACFSQEKLGLSDGFRHTHTHLHRGVQNYINSGCNQPSNGIAMGIKPSHGVLDLSHKDMVTLCILRINVVYGEKNRVPHTVVLQ